MTAKTLAVVALMVMGAIAFVASPAIAPGTCNGQVDYNCACPAGTSGCHEGEFCSVYIGSNGAKTCEVG
jgi:hypothetical protein